VSEIRTVGLVDDTVCSIKCCSPHTRKVVDNWFYLVSVMSCRDVDHMVSFPE